jgi:protein phosphatase
MKTFAITHTGLVREDNEDRYLSVELDGGSVLLAVADGMGGEAGGGLAAQIAKDCLEDFDPHSPEPEVHLLSLMQKAHEEILRQINDSPSYQGMGTTLTAAFATENRVHWAHIGDSRLYLFSGAELRQVTGDHTIPALLLRDGEITEAEAAMHPMRNILLRCIGSKHLEVDTGSFDLTEGDLLLLSTDGLHDEVPGDTIVSILSSEAGLEKRLEILVQQALEAGGRDNITIVGLEP